MSSSAKTTQTKEPVAARDDAMPDDPTATSWPAILKRTLSTFTGAGGSDLAAALTYFAIMSVAPMLLALSTMLSIFGAGDATEETINELGSDLGLDQGTLDTANQYIASMGEAEGTGLLLAVGLVGALWSASNYVNAFSRMMNTLYEVEEGRAVWKLRPWLLAVTLLIVVMLVTIVMAVSLSGSLSEAIFGQFGLSSTVTTVWNIAKWPVILLMLIGIVGVLYWGTPNVQKRFRWLSVGNAVAVIVAGLGAAGFGLYLTGFGGEQGYNETYGAIGGVIIFLLLIFIVNNVLVLGAALDLEIARSKQLGAGLPAEDDVLLPPRDEEGTRKKEAKEAEVIREARARRMAAADYRRAKGEPVGEDALKHLDS